MSKNKSRSFSRRKFIAGLTGITAGLTIKSPDIVSAMEVREDSHLKKSKRILRFAHICDIHIQPELGAPEGLAKMFQYAQGLNDKPDLFITGGDNIMDSCSANAERTKTQWLLLNEVIKKHCHLPIKYCIGNHDVWGWNKEESQTTGKENLWGKKWAVEQLHLPGRYYSFDEGNWHFIILDSTFPVEEPDMDYIGKIDEKQFSWLQQELKNTSLQTPIVIISHIPIISVAGLEFLEPEGYEISISGSFVHYDAPAIIQLIKQYPNVKVCLSGHLHLCDRIEYCGTTYICDGAVCGAWWKGDNHECDEGYGIIDLYENGTFSHQYVVYNWKPRQG